MHGGRGGVAEVPPYWLQETHAFVRVTALSTTQACRTYKLPVPNPFRSPLDN